MTGVDVLNLEIALVSGFWVGCKATLFWLDYRVARKAKP